jgi:hypothetical protein
VVQLWDLRAMEERLRALGLAREGE